MASFIRCPRWGVGCGNCNSFTHTLNLRERRGGERRGGTSRGGPGRGGTRRRGTWPGGTGPRGIRPGGTRRAGTRPGETCPHPCCTKCMVAGGAVATLCSSTVQFHVLEIGFQTGTTTYLKWSENGHTWGSPGLVCLTVLVQDALVLGIASRSCSVRRRALPLCLSKNIVRAVGRRITLFWAVVVQS